jgi:hypothetical protein
VKGQGYCFPEPALPEPVTVDDLRDRLNLLAGYLLGLFAVLEPHRTAEGRKQDAHAADALRWCVPYLRAMLVLAERHPDEFLELVPKELRP